MKIRLAEGYFWKRSAVGLFFTIGLLAAQGHAQVGRVAEGEGVRLLDRVVLRFTSPDTGGSAQPQFVFERQLAFAARLEALADPEYRAADGPPFADRHVRGALEAHIAETLLGSHEVYPPIATEQLGVRIRAAEIALLQRIGGAGALSTAAQAEGVASGEVTAWLERRARASLYLDRMVAPMLTPSETELRVAHRTTTTPFSGRPYDKIATPLRRWYVAQRLRVAVRAFYEGARTRVHVIVIKH